MEERDEQAGNTGIDAEAAVEPNDRLSGAGSDGQASVAALSGKRGGHGRTTHF